MPKADAKKTGNKRGRPPLPKGEALAAPTPIRFTEKEKAVFEKLAEKQGLSLSEWVRKTLQMSIQR